MKEVTVTKWGNGQGIRIPQTVMQMLDIETGDRLNLEVINGSIVLTPCKPDDRLTLEQLFADYHGPSYQELFSKESAELLYGMELEKEAASDNDK